MLAYRALRWFLTLVTRVFFRQIEVVGLEHVPSAGPVIFAGNHPNSLIDPILMVTTCGRIVSFAAKDVLFRSRLLRVVLRALGAVPVARREDHAEVSSQNEKAFAAMFEILGTGGAIGIFPEGLSHDASQLARFKTGAARLALSAAKDGARVHIAPCGLTFFHPKRFRSRVLVQYGEPLAIDEARLAAYRADGPQAVRALTADLERALRGLTVNAEDWQTMRVLDGVRRLYQPPQIPIEQRIELARRFNEHYPRVREQPDVKAHYARVAAYLDRLDALGLSDHDLRGPMSAGRAFFKVLRYFALICFWLPLAAPGLVLHAPVVLFARYAGRWLAPRKDVVATTKLIFGMLFILLAYAVAVAGVGWWRGLGPACATAVLLPASGFAMLQVLDRATSLEQGLSTLVGMLRLRREAAALREARAALEAETVKLVETYRPAELQPLFPRAG